MTVGTISQKEHKVIEVRAKMKLLVLKMRKNIVSESVREDDRILVVETMNIVSEVRN